MQILLIGHILVRDYLWVISQVSLGKLLISKLVGDGERESQDQNHNNLTMSFSSRIQKKNYIPLRYERSCRRSHQLCSEGLVIRKMRMGR